MLNGVGDNVMNEMRYRFAIAFVSEMWCDRTIHTMTHLVSFIWNLYIKIDTQIEKEINAGKSFRRCE